MLSSAGACKSHMESGLRGQAGLPGETLKLRLKGQIGFCLEASTAFSGNNSATDGEALQ